jgi:hypothetical protein
MNHVGFALFTAILVGSAFSQSGTWRSTITGVNLPLSAARIADAKVLSAAAKSLEAVAAENALSGRCRGTEIVEYAKPNPTSLVDTLESGLSAQGFSLENLPGGDDARYSLAARRGGNLIVLNVNALENGRVLIAWCALEPVVEALKPPAPAAPRVLKSAPPLRVAPGKYICKYTLPSGTIVQAGTITVLSSSTYRWNDDRTAHKYSYAAGRLTWRGGPFSDTETYRETRYEQDAQGRTRFTLTGRFSGGTLRWTCQTAR